LFALHQQGSDRSVNADKVSFATAIRKMAGSFNEDSVKKRFDAMITSTDVMELANHARGLIQMMKSSKYQTGFDYGLFARDLFLFQFPDGKREMRLRWGQDFYRINQNEEKIIGD